MLAGTETIATIASRWLANFERALAESDRVLLASLFHPDSHWRDVLALTWHIKTVDGLDAILRELEAHAGRANPSGFRIDSHRTAPRQV
ncbi:MAG: monooxygenase, partial [Ktedonobacterales bacterium]